MSTQHKIPDTLGELVALCCDDMDKCRVDDGYAFDMNLYALRHGDTCFVCVAGSYMVQSWGVEGDVILGYDEQSAMHAVDLVRHGCLASAIRTFHPESDKVDRVKLSDTECSELDTDDFNHCYHASIAKMRARGQAIADEEARLGLRA